MQQQLTVERCRQALQNVEPGSQLESVLEKWKDFTHTVKVNGTWKLEGFITWFQQNYEIIRAIDPSLHPAMPPQCFDPESIALFFRIPVEEFEEYMKDDTTSNLEDRVTGLESKFAESMNSGKPEQSPSNEQVATYRIATALEQACVEVKRLADHLVPPALPIVGTPYIAERLGCTTVWVTEMVRTGEIPRRCIIQGTGNGKPWKFHRHSIDQWIESR